MKLLIVKPSSLGDILHVFPALELLKRRYPDAAADWLVHPAFAEILDYSPLPIRRRILFERRELGKLRTFPAAFGRLSRALRAEKYDLVIDFQGLLRSAFFAWLANRRGPVAGFADPREHAAVFFYGKKFFVPQGMHALERNVAFVNALLGTSDPVPECRLMCSPENALSAGTAAGKTVIGLVPGARWASKQFPAELFAGVISELRRKGPENLVFWIIGSASEQDAEKRIMELAGENADIEPLAGRTSMSGMVEALRKCSAVFCNDSGPMHVAAALQVPVVALFGPTRPEWTGPYGRIHQVLRQETLSCLGCMERICPKGAETACHRINAGLAAEKILSVLHSGSAAECENITGGGAK